MNIELPQKPFFLAPLDRENSGVDFLGLRQANLDMMGEMIPSINNVTSYIRPFSLMSWVYWKFHDLCEEAGIEEANSDDLKLFRERIEVLFTWGASHHETSERIPGIWATPPPDKDGVKPLSFDAWGRVQSSTSLIAALWYGPALKTVTGLGFLSPIPGRRGFFRVSSAGAALAQSLDKKLREDGGRYDRLLATLDPVEANKGDAIALWSLWSPETVEHKEMAIFSSALMTEEAVGLNDTLLSKRSTTLSLARHHLQEAGTPQSIPEIRRGMCFSIRTDGSTYDIPAVLEKCRRKWLTLQMRQLQRLALETLLGWCEDQILRHDVVDPSAMASQFKTLWTPTDFGLGEDRTLAELINELDAKSNSVENFIGAINKHDLPDPFSIMAEITDKSRLRDPDAAASCFFGLLQCASFAGAENAPADMIQLGTAPRLSLIVLRNRLTGLENVNIAEAFEYIMEATVISQHFSTAVNRFDGRNQRLRLAIEETGLTALVSSPWKPTVTEDRLAMLLSLSAQCGLVSKNSDGEFLSNEGIENASI
ncbi:hypothetical protein [Maritalea mediterranea]|uniref:Uncharacterized protein n=1 Tax=Maritalea mediterranea TaxID=2909667 RepID=A0ABS9EB21_9HYPH|nr:hypothetical protein [Maritalea mediterranea]MCF4098641.1 hypothetical protein [Maritalea mediterranea]